MNFFVIDTEGKDVINEVALIDKNGEVVFEKFIKNEDEFKNTLLELKEIIKNSTLIAHNAKHDKEILENSFKKIGVDIDLKFKCTYEEAKKLLDLESYSLKNLSIYFNLKHNNKFFDENLAHRASYDAIFTYKLYLKLLEIKTTFENAKKHNPFSTSKVDNPFQTHFDFDEIHKTEFNALLNVLNEVKNDPNNQTKSVVVIGEAGQGKTHLMMRFVKKVSKTNRFLFIRQPNSPDNVLFHIYGRILESFWKKIDNSEYSQLEYLLAKSFSVIIINSIKSSKKTKKNENIKAILTENHLNIYKNFGVDGSATKADNWAKITTMMLKWLENSHTNNLISTNLLKALIKYTYYKDENKRNIISRYLNGYEIDQSELDKVDLKSWQDIHSKEEFALQAISLFGKLSVFDEPLILSFDQLESMKYDNELLIKFGESIKELITHTPNTLIVINLFPDRWVNFCNNFDSSVTDRIGSEIIHLLPPSKEQLRTLLKNKAKKFDIDLDLIFKEFHYSQILRFSSIRSTFNQANIYFKHIVFGTPLPKTLDILTTDEKLELLTKRVEKLENIVLQKTPKKPPILDDVKEYINTIKEKHSKEYKVPYIIDDSDDYGKLRNIFLAIKHLYQLEIDHIKLRQVFPPHIKVSNEKYNYVIGFLNLDGVSFTSRIKNFNARVINDKDLEFRLFRDIRSSKIKSKKSLEEIEKLKNSPNGNFLIMDKENRVILETFDEVITAFTNKDVDFQLSDLMKALTEIFSDFWISKFLISG